MLREVSVKSSKGDYFTWKKRKRQLNIYAILYLIHSFFEVLDCKTIVFGHFRKAGSAISAILECERLSPFSLAVFSLTPDPSHGPSLAFVKNTAVLQSIEVYNYSYLLGDPAFEWQRGWRWLCFDEDLTAFVV